MPFRSKPIIYSTAAERLATETECCWKRPSKVALSTSSWYFNLSVLFGSTTLLFHSHSISASLSAGTSDSDVDIHDSSLGATGYAPLDVEWTCPSEFSGEEWTTFLSGEEEENECLVEYRFIRTRYSCWSPSGVAPLVGRPSTRPYWNRSSTQSLAPIPL